MALLCREEHAGIFASAKDSQQAKLNQTQKGWKTHKTYTWIFQL